MAIITVTGEISADQLGVTLAHEHILADTSKDYREPPEWVKAFMQYCGISLEEGVTLRNFGLLMREPQWSIDNQILSSYDDALEELAIAKRAGIKSVLDPTPIGLGRNPVALCDLSLALDMYIVTGTGYYRQAFHPPETATMTVDQIEEKMTRELLEGIDGTRVRAGVMGELGTSDDLILPIEMKTLIAAGRVNKRTNAPIMIHKGGGRDLAMEVLRILKENGANLEKVHMCHVCEAPYWKEIADTGASVGLDQFGSTFNVDSEVAMLPTDVERIRALKRILDAGYGHKVLIGNDICMKMRLHKYGGWGYDHIQTNLLPYMYKAGISDEQLHMLHVENPACFLDTES
jgi:phosphotriesterase-related protein